MTDSPASNRKPADRLVELREQIRILKTEEKQLREDFISGALDPVGDDHTVIIDRKATERIDREQMREHVEESIWKPFLIEKPIVYVNVRRKQMTDTIRATAGAANRLEALVKELEIAGYRIISGANDGLIDWRTDEALGYDGPDNERPGNWCHIDHILAACVSHERRDCTSLEIVKRKFDPT